MIFKNYLELFDVPVNAWKKGSYSGDVGRTIPSFRITVEKEKILVAPMEIIDNKK